MSAFSSPYLRCPLPGAPGCVVVPPLLVVTIALMGVPFAALALMMAMVPAAPPAATPPMSAPAIVTALPPVSGPPPAQRQAPPASHEDRCVHCKGDHLSQRCFTKFRDRFLGMSLDEALAFVQELDAHLITGNPWHGSDKVYDQVRSRLGYWSASVFCHLLVGLWHPHALRSGTPLPRLPSPPL